MFSRIVSLLPQAEGLGIGEGGAQRPSGRGREAAEVGRALSDRFGKVLAARRPCRRGRFAAPHGRPRIVIADVVRGSERLTDATAWECSEKHAASECRGSKLRAQAIGAAISRKFRCCVSNMHICQLAAVRREICSASAPMRKKRCAHKFAVGPNRLVKA